MLLTERREGRINRYYQRSVNTEKRLHRGNHRFAEAVQQRLFRNFFCDVMPIKKKNAGGVYRPFLQSNYFATPQVFFK